MDVAIVVRYVNVGNKYNRIQYFGLFLSSRSTSVVQTTYGGQRWSICALNDKFKQNRFECKLQNNPIATFLRLIQSIFYKMSFQDQGCPPSVPGLIIFSLFENSDGPAHPIASF